MYILVVQIGFFLIDWLTIELPFVHRPIAQGRCMVIDHDGVITSDFVRLRGVENFFDDEGSYSARIAVSSGSTAYTVAEAGELGEGQVSGLLVSGNPAKYLQGHNVFGLSCLRSLVRGCLADVLPKLGFDHVSLRRVLVLIDAGRYKVTRIDITKMFCLGSDQAVNDYLRMLPFTMSARGDRCEFVKNTFYVGRRSQLWALKLYNKFKEVSARSKGHALPKFLLRDDFFRFVNGQLRVELVLRRKVLDRLELTDPLLLQDKLNELFAEFVGKVVMKNQEIKEADYMSLSSAYQGTISLWRQGRCLKSLLSKPTYYRHRRKLLGVGIDIAKPPIAREERLVLVRPLKLLAPKEVTLADLPPSLRPYLARQVV